MIGRIKAYMQRRKEQKKKVEAPKVEVDDVVDGYEGFTDFMRIPESPIPKTPVAVNRVIEDDAALPPPARRVEPDNWERHAEAHTPSRAYDDSASRSSSSYSSPSYDSSPSYSSSYSSDSGSCGGGDSGGGSCGGGD